ncbi:hypothetical protein NP569_24680, partial [Vibrio parahaemolyticus]|nr:hypothetical protein [Vibrio parahaemolyticus]
KPGVTYDTFLKNNYEFKLSDLEMKFVSLQYSLKISHSMKEQPLELGMVAPICESSIWVLRQPRVHRHKTLSQPEKKKVISKS